MSRPQFLLTSVLFLLLAIPNVLLAQVPQGIQFQAVARDASGIPLANQAITVVFLVQNAAATTVYSETHAVNTDGFGLFEAVVGQGTPTLSTFTALDWSANQYQVQIQINGTLLSTCQFQSVPYALYAEKSNMAMVDLTDVDATGLLPGQVLTWNGTKWIPAAGNSQVWSQNLTNAYYNLGRVGIGTNAPLTTFQMRDTANFLIGNDLTGSGFKMLYYGAKGAFRAGFLTNPFGGYNYDKFWDYDSVGYYSFAAGQNSRAKGFGSFAFGSFGWADGSGSVAFFGNAKGNGSFTFGGSSKGRGSITFEGTAEEEGGIAMYGYTGGRYGVSIGGGTTGLGASSSRQDYAVAIGWNSDARGQASVALGPSDAYGYNSFSTGWVTEARGNYSSTFGYRTNSFPYASMAIGRYNVITGDSAAWNANDPIFMVGDGANNTARSNSFTILKNGRTSIGYDTPVGMLQVSSALGSLSTAGGLTPANATLLLGTTTVGMAFDANQIEMIGSRLNMNYNSVQDISMAFGGGRVAIGNTTAPSDRLHISVLAAEYPLRIQIGGTTRMRVHANGGTSLGANVTPPVAGLYITGETRFDNNAYPDNDNAYSMGTATRRWQAVYAVNGTIQTSDIRDKTAIRQLNYGLDEVMALRPVRFEWKARPQAGDKVGLIAQELQQVVPEAVYQEENDPEARLGVNYAELVPVLIQAIQEQQSLIDQQQKELKNLRVEMEALRTDISQK